MDGFELRFNKTSDVDGSGKCSINPGDAVVHFAIFDILESERRALDRIEGLGQGYDQVVIEVPGFGQCTTYIADPSVVNEALRPMDWYKEMVVQGCRAHRFPDSYVDRIASVQAIKDPDDERARMNWEIVSELS